MEARATAGVDDVQVATLGNLFANGRQFNGSQGFAFGQTGQILSLALAEVVPGDSDGWAVFGFAIFTLISLLVLLVPDGRGSEPRSTVLGAAP